MSAEAKGNSSAAKTGKSQGPKKRKEMPGPKPQFEPSWKWFIEQAPKSDLLRAGRETELSFGVRCLASMSRHRLQTVWQARRAYIEANHREEFLAIVVACFEKDRVERARRSVQSANQSLENRKRRAEVEAEVERECELLAEWLAHSATTHQLIGIVHGSVDFQSCPSGSSGRDPWRWRPIPNFFVAPSNTKTTKTVFQMSNILYNSSHRHLTYSLTPTRTLSWMYANPPAVPAPEHYQDRPGQAVDQQRIWTPAETLSFQSWMRSLVRDLHSEALPDNTGFTRLAIRSSYIWSLLQQHVIDLTPLSWLILVFFGDSHS